MGMNKEPTWPTADQERAWRAELDRLVEAGGIMFRLDPAPSVHSPGEPVLLAAPLGEYVRKLIARAKP
jgi:hypothetical protein